MFLRRFNSELRGGVLLNLGHLMTYQRLGACTERRNIWRIDRLTQQELS